MDLQEAIFRHRDMGALLSFGSPEDSDALSKLPPDYVRFLRKTNGMMTGDDSLQVYGVAELIDANASEWKKDYGNLTHGLLFAAQDAFGNQYGYRTCGDNSRGIFKFMCEGGEIRFLGISTLDELLAGWLSCDDRFGFDWPMFRALASLGPFLRKGRHIGFELPLIAGGDYDARNAVAEGIDLHMGTLSQLTRKNMLLPDGQAIKRFRDVC